MSKARDLADFISTGSILSDGTIESTEISGVTATANEINVLDGISVTTEELNNVAGINSDVQTQLDGKQDVVSGVSDTEIGYLDGVTSNLQTQLDNITVTAGTLTKSFSNGETASIALSAALSPAPVVSVTKEVPQTGQSSKGAWDVATDGANYDRHNTAYDVTLTPSSSTTYQSADNISYTNSLDVSSLIQYLRDVQFNPDGTKMFLLAENRGTGSTVTQYSLSTAYDVTTATSDSVTFDSSTDNSTRGFDFNADGTKVYIVGYQADEVRQYSLGTAYDFSSVTDDGISFDVSSQDDVASEFKWADSGTKFYVVGQATQKIYQYSVTTPYDISTASLVQSILNPAVSSVVPRGITFSDDGLTMYFAGNNGSGNHLFYEYSLSVAFDISSTLTEVSNFGLSANTSNPYNFAMAGSNLYVVDTSGPNIRQYDFPTTTTNTLTLGSGSFASTDVGKTIEGNGGEVILTATDGSYSVVTAFNDSSTIAAGSWAMYALTFDATNGVELSGFTSSTSFSPESQVATSETLSLSALPNFIYYTGLSIENSGSRLYIIGGDASANGANVYQYTLSTPHDITTATYNGRTSTAAQITFTNGAAFKTDGTAVFVVDAYGFIRKYDITVPWDIVGNMSYSGSDLNISGQTTAPAGVAFSPDGTKMFVVDETRSVYEYTLSTPWSVSSGSYVRSEAIDAGAGQTEDLKFNADGTKLFVLANGSNRIYTYTLSAPYTLASFPSTYTSVFDYSSITTGGRGFDFGGENNEKIYFAKNPVVVSTSVTQIQTTAQYSPAITNASGQISTAFWTDINSMTADQTANDGEVYYAVSTDDRTTWSVIKDSDGVRPIVRDNAGTWQYNSDNVSTSTFDVTGATYSGDATTFSTSSQDTQSYTVSVKPDGTKIYVASFNSDAVYQYDLSTAFDLSTASYNSISFNFSAQMSTPRDIQFKPDGTEMYLNDLNTGAIYQYTMSTAWDLSTASYSGYSFNTSITSNTYGIFFKPDGTKLYISDSGSTDQLIYEHTLTTPWRVDTASYDSKYLNARTQMSNVLTSFAINPTGTKVHAYDYGSETLYEYDLSTAWDMSTASYNNVSVSLNPSATYSGPTTFHLDYTSGYLYAMRSERLFEWTGLVTSTLPYSTTATWADATANDELSALQEALSLANNRMDKTQLDAVTDPNHYTLGDSLDLMIALYLGSSGTSPTSDGVSINYDAEALNQGAVLGTDYDYDFPDSSTVRITSNAAQNLKVRVV